MEIEEIHQQLKQIDKHWYRDKVKFFKGEPFYNPETKIIEYPLSPDVFTWLEPSQKANAVNPNSLTEFVALKTQMVDEYDEFGNPAGQLDYFYRDKRIIEFKDYCFNSNFYGSINSYNYTQDDDGEYIPIFETPIDLSTIIENVITYFRKELPKSLELAILIPGINTALISFKVLLIVENPSGYLAYIKKILFGRIESFIKKEYYAQLKAYDKRPESFQTALSLTKCKLICDLSLFPETLNNVFKTKKNGLKAHEFLFNILSPDPPPYSKTYFEIECQKNVFYNFIWNIEVHHSLTITELATTYAFQIKRVPFNAKNYKAYKSRSKLVPLNELIEILKS